MGFFDITPERAGRAARPDGIIPGFAAAGLFLIRTDELAVAVGSVQAYPNGFEFTVHARVHHGQLPWGTSPLDPAADPRTNSDPDLALRLGVLYADGRRARTGTFRPMPVDDGDDDQYLVLRETGTGGTERQWDGRFWVHPLPTDGPVTFVASWLLHEVAETRADLDSSVIHEAAQRAVTLWPDEP